VEAYAGQRAIISGALEESSLEYPCHSPTRERWYLMHAARYTGPGEACVVVAHVEVTRRVVSQRALRGAHEYLRTITDSMGEGLFAIDAAGRVTFLNEAAENCSAGAVLGELAVFRCLGAAVETPKSAVLQAVCMKATTGIEPV
jgi:transcriptional regulator with PAS, ATPase and Fis domain